LIALFADFGRLSEVKIVYDRESGQSKGFGFVELADEVAGRRAIEELNGDEYGYEGQERRLKVAVATPRPERQPEGPGPANIKIAGLAASGDTRVAAGRKLEAWVTREDTREA
jgi:RNA recognition motif-containing protein